MWTENDSSNRWVTEKDGDYNRGKWTPSEKIRFKVALELYNKDWKKIQRVVETRKLTQVHSYAQKYFLRLQKAKANLKSAAWYQKDLKEELLDAKFKIYCWYAVDY